MPSDATVRQESRFAFAEFRAQVEDACRLIGIEEARKPKFGAYAAVDGLYRGHSSKSYALQPTLMRAARESEVHIAIVEMSEKDRDQALGEMHDLESQLFYEFAPRGKKLVPSVHSDWDILFLMRHHSLATRLLDWTQSFGVALYFALCPWLNDRQRLQESLKETSEDEWEFPSIWVLNPYRLNMKEEGPDSEDILAPRFLDHDDGSSYGDWLGDTHGRGMGWRYPKAIFPETLNDRLHAQQGLFTIWGDLHDPLEDLVGVDVVRQVQLPKQALRAALEFLSDAGICESSLFPDLDALARDIHRRYRFPSPTVRRTFSPTSLD